MEERSRSTFGPTAFTKRPGPDISESPANLVYTALDASCPVRRSHGGEKLDGSQQGNTDRALKF
jgi:hypothetical protein